MGETLMLVPTDCVEDLWSTVTEFLNLPLAKHPLSCSLEYIKQEIQEERMQLWILADNDSKEVIGAGTTTVVVECGWTVGIIYLLGGADMKKWVKVLPGFMEWAREVGCDYVQAIGREGFKNVLPELGFKSGMRLYTKRVSYVQ